MFGAAEASAGTGKSFLLTTVYLWCLVHKMRTEAVAPTGIAAANIEIEKTGVSATTIHNMFELDSEYKTKLDFAKVTHPKVAALLALQVLLIDECSMLDKQCYAGIEEVLSIVDHSRRPKAPVSSDLFGDVHILLFGDFKVIVVSR